MMRSHLSISRAATPWRRALLNAILLIGIGLPLLAQEAPLSTSAIQSDRDSVSQRLEIPEADRNAIVAQYDEALRLLAIADEQRAAAAEFEKSRAGAAAYEAELEAQLEQLTAAKPYVAAEGAGLPEIEAMLAQLESEYKAAQAEFETVMTAPERRATRRREIPALQSAVQQRIADAQEAMRSPQTETERPEAAAARRTIAGARLLAAQAESALLSAELASNEATSPMVSTRQEIAKVRLTNIERDLKLLQEAASRVRREDATKAAQQARDDLLKIPDIDASIQELALRLATENEAIAAERVSDSGISQKVEQATQKLQEERATATSLREEYAAVVQRVNTGGFSGTVGVLLRKQRANLPNERALRAVIRNRQQEAAQVELAETERRRQRIALADTTREIDAAFETTLASLSKYEQGKIRDILVKLANDQRTLLDALLADYSRYLYLLEDLNTTDQELLTLTNQFRAFVDENILWIRGPSPLTAALPANLIEATRWFTDPRVLQQAMTLFADDASANVLGAGLPALLALSLVLIRRPSRNRLQDLGPIARSKKDTHFGHSIMAAVYTNLAALALPALLWYAGSRLQISAGVIPQAAALSAGLLQAASVALGIEFLRALLLKNGLADAHFGWPIAAAGNQLRILLSLTLVWLIPLVTLCVALGAQLDDTYSASLGSVAFLAAMLASAFTLRQAFVISRTAIVAADPEHWLARSSPLTRAMSAAMVLVPLALALLALSGYYYSALQVCMKSFQTLQVLLTALFLSGMARRWLLLGRRKIAIDMARRMREAAKADAELEEMSERTEVPVEPAPDILRINAQSLAAIRTVTILGSLIFSWFIWVDVVPALNILDRFPLWETAVDVTEEVKAADGTVQVNTVKRMVPVTAANLLLTLLVIMVTVAAVRNLPGLIEIVILQRLSMASGERYAILAVFRYATAAIGIVLAFQSIGIGWSRVQWLVAALGVGLGFGLQEIFANFISGLILLFERPVRVGDVVTINGTSGSVSQIRIRATTICDFDNKELIVPNKQFVTGHVLNWSLSNTRVRIVLPIGISYKSDIQSALRLLRKAATEHPLALKEPPPMVLFMGFGDNAINFEVRIHSPDPDSISVIRHDVLLAIDRYFREAGIEIPFPQRDVHIHASADSPQIPLPGIPARKQ